MPLPYTSSSLLGIYAKKIDPKTGKLIGSGSTVPTQPSQPSTIQTPMPTSAWKPTTAAGNTPTASTTPSGVVRDPTRTTWGSTPPKSNTEVIDQITKTLPEEVKPVTKVQSVTLPDMPAPVFNTVQAPPAKTTMNVQPQEQWQDDLSRLIFGDKAPATTIGTGTVTAPPSAPSAPPPVAPKDPTKSDLAGNKALDAIIAGLDGTPSAAVQNQITAAREMIAKASQAAARQTARDVSVSGALGQGTQNAALTGLRQSAVEQLANTELGNSQLVANEQEQMRQAAINAYENSKNREQNQSQFETNANQNQQQIDNQAAQFEKNLASADRSTMLNALERMSVDNPVLAAKLTDYMMKDGSGAIGAFTDSEKAQINKYVADKKTTQDKLDAANIKLLDSLPGMIDANNNSQSDAQKEAERQKAVSEATRKLQSLQPGQKLSDSDFATLNAANAIPKATLITIPKYTETANWLKDNPTGIVSIEGQQYKVLEGGRTRTGAGTTRVQERHTDWVKVIDPAGVTKYIWDNGIHDTPPKEVSNDWTPFGF